MFDNVTDSIKFFIFLIIYTVAIGYWAGEVTGTLDAQTINLSAQTELLNVHIKDCADKNITHVRLEELVIHLRKDVDFLLIEQRKRDLVNGFEKGRN